jgi:hypothetical protein
MILDAHPEIGCPAEAGLPSLMSHMAAVWMTVDADVIGGRSAKDPGRLPPEQLGEPGYPEEPRQDRAGGSVTVPELPRDARDWIRRTLDEAMFQYTTRGMKRLYIDKSLDSVHHLALVRELFPSMRCVLAFRHVMDTVASGIEASPWGFQAYGYAPYVYASPGNTVAALANYWLAHVATALDWQEQHPEICYRVRYEDLVLDPEATVRGILRFLEVEEDLSVLHTAFQREPANGPGDYKVVHTSAVHASSIGHGKRVPIGMLPPPLLQAVNEKLEALGYDRLTSAWNAEERAVDLGGVGLWAERLTEWMASVRSGPGAAHELGSFAVVAEDHHALRWIIEPESGSVTQGDGEVESVVTGTAEDLVLALTGEENLGVLLRAGRIRHLTPSVDDHPRDLSATVMRIVEHLRDGVYTTGPAGH